MNYHAHLSPTPLSLPDAYAYVHDPACGGLAFFVGTIRDLNLGETVTHLEFDAYGKMAVLEMNTICERALADFDVRRVALHHRTGHLDIGDVAVIVAVASVHRAPAFAACAWMIDELKRTVPIWKKEFRGDGSHWLNSRP